MGFPKKVADNVLVKCKRHCCLCGKYFGINIELHHIKQKADGGEDTEDNCIPLCFNCHAEVRSYNTHHPKGHKYTDTELKHRRDEIYLRVQNEIINILSVNDISKARKIMDTYGRFLEQLIALDPCAEPFDIMTIDYIDGICDYLNSYSYDFENHVLEQQKCNLINSLIELRNIFINDDYFHILNDGRRCFNNYSVNEYREAVYNLRINIRNSYCSFRDTLR